MVTTKDFVNIRLSKDEILLCMQKARDNKFLDNLRNRHPNVQFDCKVRGYVGEMAIRKWFESENIDIEASDYIEGDDSIDIDFKVKGRNIEIKTSLIPDKDGSLDNVLEKRDIKLICRNNQPIEQLRGDIHVQIYFRQRTRKKDEWLKKQRVNVKKDGLETLYGSFRADAYINTTYIVAWIDKDSLVERISKMPENDRQWSFKGSFRRFWTCKLKQANQPKSLIDYLRGL